MEKSIKTKNVNDVFETFIPNNEAKKNIQKLSESIILPESLTSKQKKNIVNKVTRDIDSNLATNKKTPKQVVADLNKLKLNNIKFNWEEDRIANNNRKILNEMSLSRSFMSNKGAKKNNKALEYANDRAFIENNNPSLRLRGAPVINCTNYHDSILYPEKAMNAKIPDQFGLKTVAFRRHISRTISANAGGNLNIVWGPTFLSENGVDLSQYLICNDGTYDPVTGIGLGTTQLLDWSLPANQISSYRIVSAAMILLPQSSALNMQGKITAAVINTKVFSAAPAGTAYNPAILGKLSVLDQEETCTIANIAGGQGARLIYTPIDIQDFAMYEINTSETYSGVGKPGVSPVFSVIVSGAQANAPFTVEIYLNFEATPQLGSILTGLGTQCTETTQPTVILKHIKQNPSLLSMVYTGLPPLAASLSSYNKMLLPPNVASLPDNNEFKQLVSKGLLGTDMTTYLAEQNRLQTPKY